MNRLFVYCMKMKNQNSTKFYNINARVPQGSVVGLILYLLFTANILTIENTTIATFADNTTIMSSSMSQVRPLIISRYHSITYHDRQDGGVLTLNVLVSPYHNYKQTERFTFHSLPKWSTGSISRYSEVLQTLLRLLLKLKALFDKKPYKYCRSSASSIG